MTPRTPTGLGLRGRRLWRHVVDAYEVSPDSREVLVEACRALDVIDRLEAEMRDAPLTVAGSQGQQVAHPLLHELRLWKQTAARLIGQLGLPTLDELEAGVPAGKSRSQMGRDAALARWRR
jgi:hypothetical protein